ncbi:protein lifeguard 1-like isoform X2 [Acanthaster planci]|uniref:Protein lifeguard 1-like isoform X2 n=1 Tax=Acanthaster planci TaxID=133434 RepID=A0A8B7ZM27_ACAPL|nr:protein lifeguard 1-like isoform X2 [Acanthaster planci]
MAAPATPSAPPSYDEAVVGGADPAYPPAQPAYPPAQPAYQSEGYPPPQGGYPAPQAAYPPQSTEGYPPSEAYPQGAVYQPQPQPQAAATSYGTSPSDDVEGFSAQRSLNDKSIRRKFILKVYLILTAQLAVTFGVVCLFYFVDSVRFFVQRNQAMYWASYGIFLFVYIVLVCCADFRRKTPHNFIALAIFTLSLAYMTGTIASFYHEGGGRTVLIAIGICAGVTIGITLFSIQTRFDFTSCGGFLFVFAWSLFLFGFIAIFTYSQILYTVYAWLAAVLFSLFLAYDTQLLVGGRRYELSPEEYIFGALNLYIDVVYLFLIILSLVGGGNR